MAFESGLEPGKVRKVCARIQRGTIMVGLTAELLKSPAVEPPVSPGHRVARGHRQTQGGRLEKLGHERLPAGEAVCATTGNVDPARPYGVLALGVGARSPDSAELPSYHFRNHLKITHQVV